MRSFVNGTRYVYFVIAGTSEIDKHNRLAGEDARLETAAYLFCDRLLETAATEPSALQAIVFGAVIEEMNAGFCLVSPYSMANSLRGAFPGNIHCTGWVCSFMQQIRNELGGIWAIARDLGAQAFRFSLAKLDLKMRLSRFHARCRVVALSTLASTAFIASSSARFSSGPP